MVDADRCVLSEVFIWMHDVYRMTSKLRSLESYDVRCSRPLKALLASSSLSPSIQDSTGIVLETFLGRGKLKASLVTTTFKIEGLDIFFFMPGWTRGRCRSK